MRSRLEPAAEAALLSSNQQSSASSHVIALFQTLRCTRQEIHRCTWQVVGLK